MLPTSTSTCIEQLRALSWLTRAFIGTTGEKTTKVGAYFGTETRGSGAPEAIDAIIWKITVVIRRSRLLDRFAAIMSTWMRQAHPEVGD
ncbi:hypothetical protein THAOC_31182 [Thalassiosira oceanica]|uniref:Uncharacterized protein n=1 Tax=Thalassiosira oceanica TaxID=159749 RepID=K0RT85_THAOC|nr:hypothetical protein THAOC_31182 [Thalassiosira oceanica]|eukprot:EJK49892.1 hypothetical protein THAOC_31182 [Thalassiosira oceanica]